MVRKHKRKRVAKARGKRLDAPVWPSQRRSIDSVPDVCLEEQHIRVLTAIDQFTRECLCLESGCSFPSRSITATMDQVVDKRGKRESIACANGSEVTANHFDAGAHNKRITLDSIRCARPVKNAFIESFNGTLCHKCLNATPFTSLVHARKEIEGMEARPLNE